VNETSNTLFIDSTPKESNINNVTSVAQKTGIYDTVPKENENWMSPPQNHSNLVEGVPAHNNSDLALAMNISSSNTSLILNQ